MKSASQASSQALPVKPAQTVIPFKRKPERRGDERRLRHQAWHGSAAELLEHQHRVELVHLKTTGRLRHHQPENPSICKGFPDLAATP